MEGRQQAAEDCADRCLAEAIAHWQIGKTVTAAALFRATARYLEGLGEESGPGQVIAFPSPANNRRVRMSDPGSARLESQNAAGVSRVELGS